MKIISIAGATSKAGKTLLAEQLIRYCVGKFDPVYAVKFTTTSDLPSPCPRGAPCTVCDLSDNFRVVRDKETILQSGKNTARFAAAGPTEVVWVISKRSQLPRAYEHLQTHIPDNALVIMEGSSITSLCKPDLLFYVFANHIAPSRWKESATEIIGHSDFVVMNSKAKFPDHPDIKIPQGQLRIDLSAQAVTEIPEIRDKINVLLKSLQSCNSV
jgi:hypothetical protein